MKRILDKTERVKVREGSIRHALDDAHMTYPQLSAETGYDLSTLRKWNRSVHNPTLNQLRIVAATLGVTVSALLDDVPGAFVGGMVDVSAFPLLRSELSSDGPAEGLAQAELDAVEVEGATVKVTIKITVE